ncbi:MAG TPA: RNA polymerase sigma factor [Sphingomicrobium sp.]|nr:RNA polymerase sigma factor [Sphingomicrobium sp.]
MTGRSQMVAALRDVELARLCAARDEPALRHVITANNQRLFRAAWSILKDRSEAEEAVQSAYLRAFDRIDDYEGRSALSTWLTSIVINEALGRLRANRRRRVALEEQGVAVLETYREALMRGSEPIAPDANVARQQLRQLLEQAVAGLPQAFRSVFVLRDVEGLSVEETAEVLGIPAPTVKTRLHRARLKLQEALAPEVRSALVGAFPFAGADCVAMTERVLTGILMR